MSGRRREEKTPKLNRFVFLFPTFFVVFVDQLTKILAQSYLSPGTSVPLVLNVFHLTLVENQGIAFGLFQGSGRLLLALVTVSILLLVGMGLRHSSAASRTQWGMGLLLGGALGNWVDRLRVGAVIDFLDFRIWPVFNLADTAITVGVGIFLLELFPKRRVS